MFQKKSQKEEYPDITVVCGTKEKNIKPNARDIIVENLSLTFHGVELLKDAELNLAYGQRYGLIGLNGVGKTTLLRALASRKVPYPKNLSVFSVQSAIEASELTALEAVLEVDRERIELEEEVDRLAELLGTDSDDATNERLEQIYERLEELSADTAKMRAAKILEGLGFDAEMQNKRCKDFSGGWRMRISLARALFLNPDFLILDDASAHLDLSAVVWLEDYLSKFTKILLLVSHSQDFMNGVCKNIILFRNKKLITFGGNYDTYVRTREELETNQMKAHNWEQDQIAHMKEYIAKFGHGSAKLARQAQSKEKTLEKMVRGGLTEAVTKDRVAEIRFTPCGKLPPPVLQLLDVSFSYPGDKTLIYKNLEFGADLDSRIVLVGPNGAGKSTLLKLIMGTLTPTDGMIRRHSALKFGIFQQHTVEVLPGEMTPLEYMMNLFPKDYEGNSMTLEKMRSIVGRFGITGSVQTMKINQLSDGQKARVVFSQIAESRPNFLLLDEPSNSLDLETIDALADAIMNWDGGVIVVSHDFRLLSKIANEIYICDHGITKFDGDIMAYKKMLKKKL